MQCGLMAEASLRLRWERCVALVMAGTTRKPQRCQGLCCFFLVEGLVEHGQVAEARLSLRREWSVAVVVTGASRRPRGIWHGPLER